jgi:hypothetical protein
MTQKVLNKPLLKLIILVIKINLVGRRSQRHEGYKVKTTRQSVQGLWQANMFNTFPRHGILQFKSVPKDPISLEDIGAVRDNVKRNKRQTYVRRYKSRKPEGDEL